MTSKKFHELLAARIGRAREGLGQYVQEFVIGQDCLFERHKLIESGTTLSPHEHRRERQIKDSRSVTLVKIDAVSRERWLHSVELLYVEVRSEDDVHLHATRKGRGYVEEIPWDRLGLPENQVILNELEFLLGPLIPPASVGD